MAIRERMYGVVNMEHKAFAEKMLTAMKERMSLTSANQLTETLNRDGVLYTVESNHGIDKIKIIAPRSGSGGGGGIGSGGEVRDGQFIINELVDELILPPQKIDLVPVDLTDDFVDLVTGTGLFEARVIHMPHWHPLIERGTSTSIWGAVPFGAGIGFPINKWNVINTAIGDNFPREYSRKPFYEWDITYCCAYSIGTGTSHGLYDDRANYASNINFHDLVENSGHLTIGLIPYDPRVFEVLNYEETFNTRTHGVISRATIIRDILNGTEARGAATNHRPKGNNNFILADIGAHAVVSAFSQEPSIYFEEEDTFRPYPGMISEWVSLGLKRIYVFATDNDQTQDGADAYAPNRSIGTGPERDHLGSLGVTVEPAYFQGIAAYNFGDQEYGIGQVYDYKIRENIRSLSASFLDDLDRLGMELASSKVGADIAGVTNFTGSDYTQ